MTTTASESYAVIATYLALPIRNTLVPQLGHVPLVAGRPFFKVVGCGFLISLLARHLKQYASIDLTPTNLYQLPIYIAQVICQGYLRSVPLHTDPDSLAFCSPS